MKTVRRLIFRSIASHVGLVGLAFAALSLFIDLVDEVQNVGRNGYQLMSALVTCLLLQGSHVYDLFPIALLIGSILAMARLAQSSEFTILRTAGLGPGRALMLLTTMGAIAACLIVVVGNWYMPWSERQLNLHRAQFGNQKGLDLAKGGTWLRERRTLPGGQAQIVTVNVGAAESTGLFRAVRIFEFDTSGHLMSRIAAQKAVIQDLGPAGTIWRLEGAVRTVWHPHQDIDSEAVMAGQQLIDEQRPDSLAWHSSLTQQLVSASVLPPETMSTVALWRYTQHLANNAQAAQRYEIAFWNKSLYPLVCFVMVALALPFAYLHARSGGMNLKIFGGIMLGISFVLANHISSHLGLLHQWEPWLAASAPSVFYLLLSMGAFVWLVRYR
jgi:lipopolysaccharide export system permease protein